eukprot:3340250-Heterocapsa_arctica.AAC.1
MGRANWVAKVYFVSVRLPQLPAPMPGLPGTSWDPARTAYIQGLLAQWGNDGTWTTHSLCVRASSHATPRKILA